MLLMKVRSDIRVNEQGAISVVGLKNQKLTSKINNAAVRILKSEAPIKTGKFRNSIKILESVRNPSPEMYTALSIVGPTAPHSKYVVRRTRASAGAYIPALDVRIRFGRHPGTKANPIVKRSLPRIFEAAKRIVNEEYGPGRFDVLKFIKVQ